MWRTGPETPSWLAFAGGIVVVIGATLAWRRARREPRRRTRFDVAHRCRASSAQLGTVQSSRSCSKLAGPPGDPVSIPSDRGDGLLSGLVLQVGGGHGVDQLLVVDG
jgi:LPXTG-motif cell wall-anchored protein